MSDPIGTVIAVGQPGPFGANVMAGRVVVRCGPPFSPLTITADMVGESYYDVTAEIVARLDAAYRDSLLERIKDAMRSGQL